MNLTDRELIFLKETLKAIYATGTKLDSSGRYSAILPKLDRLKIATLLSKTRQKLRDLKDPDIHRFRIYADGSVIHEDDYPSMDNWSSDDWMEYEVPSAIYEYISEGQLNETFIP